MATPRVDPARIVDEALRLLRAGGLEAVSLRRIATGLGAGASTLYWHFRDKDALLAALAERIFRDCLDAVGAQADWQGWLRAFGLALWQAQVDIPDVHRLIVLARHDPARRAAASSAITDTLQRLGMGKDQAVLAQRSVQALVTGWTTLAGADDLARPADRESVDRALEALICGWATTASHKTLAQLSSCTSV